VLRLIWCFICVSVLLCFYVLSFYFFFFFFSSRRRHTRCLSDWSSDVCSSDLRAPMPAGPPRRVYDPSGHCARGREQISPGLRSRSEERRVGKECRSRWSPDH